MKHDHCEDTNLTTLEESNWFADLGTFYSYLNNYNTICLPYNMINVALNLTGVNMFAYGLAPNWCQNTGNHVGRLADL